MEYLRVIFQSRGCIQTSKKRGFPTLNTQWNKRDRNGHKKRTLVCDGRSKGRAERK